MAHHSSTGALAIFARAPVPGKAKTRLIPLLGASAAAEFQSALIADSLRRFAPMGTRFGLFFMAANARAWPAALHSSGCAAQADFARFRILRQRGRDLGTRLGHAFALLFRNYSRAVIIGTDSPELHLATVIRAFRSLLQVPAVLGPCEDGGYYLVGLRRDGLAAGRTGALPAPLFQGVRWGTRWALHDTAGNFQRCGLPCAYLEPLADIDRPGDLLQLGRRMATKPSLRRRAPAAWRFLRGIEQSPHG